MAYFAQQPQKKSSLNAVQRSSHMESVLDLVRAIPKADVRTNFLEDAVNLRKPVITLRTHAA